MLIVALISTVALLIWMGFFMMSSLPLLILKHDTALDARFIRGLFNIYYVGLMSVATAGVLIHAISGRYGIALGVGCMAMIGFARCRWLVGRMDTLRNTMTAICGWHKRVPPAPQNGHGAFARRVLRGDDARAVWTLTTSLRLGRGPCECPAAIH